MMNKQIFILFIGLALTTSLSAQNPEFVNRGGLGYLKFGLGFGSNDNLNDDLNNTFEQETSLKNYSYQVGAGGFVLFSKRIILGLEGYGLFHPLEEVGPYSAKLSGGGGEVKFGFAVLNDAKILGFPYIGIGFGGGNLEIKNDDSEPVDFGGTTVPQYFEERLKVNYTILDIGVSIFRIPAPDIDGLSIGGHIGFRTALGKDTWTMDNGNQVVGTNDVGFSNFYIKISVGAGGFFNKKKKETP